MEKRLLDTFDGLKLTDRQKKLFEKVYVKRILVSKQNKCVHVSIVSDFVIPYREIRLLEHSLNHVMRRMGFQVSVSEQFSLSEQYTPEIFWEEYKESVFEILRGKNALLFHMLYKGNVSVEGTQMTLRCEDDLLFRARKEEISSLLSEIFKEKAGFLMEVQVEFSLEKKAGEAMDYEVYRRNEQGYFSTIKVKDLYSKTPFSREEYAELRTSGGEHLKSQHSGNVPVLSENTGEINSLSDTPKEVYADGMAYGSAKDAEYAALAAAESAQRFQEMDVTAPKNGTEKGKAGSGKNASVKEDREEKGDYKKGSFYKKNKSKWGQGPVDEECFYGRNCEGEQIKIADIIGEMQGIVIDGMVIGVEEREIRGERFIYMFQVSDFTNSIEVKIFTDKEELPLLQENIAKGKFLKIKGNCVYDDFSRDYTITAVKGIKAGVDTRVKRMDTYEGRKRVELHAHTQMSEMDSVMSVEDYVKTAKAFGHTAAAITDHGVVQAFPDADHMLKPDEDFKMIYGVEAYLVDDLIETVKNEKGQNFHDDFVVFDLETTGIGAKSNEIIEIGAVKIKDGTMTETFSEFVNPKRPIPYRIQELTGIQDAMVQNAETIDVLLPKFLDFCEGCVMVAHNADFDIGFISQKAKDRGIETDFTVIDTVSVARALLPDLKRYKLDTVAKKLGVSLENHHRAVDDATATAEIFLHMMDRLKDKGIDDLKKLNEFGKPDAETIRKLPSYHAVILAKNEIGRVNLYRLVSESHLKYFNRRPKLPKSLFMQWREGLILGSACEAGELFRAVLEEKPDEEIDRLVKFYDYLEIQPIGNNAFMLRDEDKYPQIQDETDLQELNRKIVHLGEEYKKPVVATCDVHFLNPEDEVYRRIIMSGKGFSDADEQAPLYFRTTEEMLEEFQYLGAKKAEEIVIENTNLIADMIDKIRPCSPRKCPPQIENSDKELREICYRKAHEIYGPELPPEVEERLERELNSIISNGYAVMYIIAQKLVWKSVEDGYLVGSRGSVGSSFAATMAGITEINPLPAHYYCAECHYYEFNPPELKGKAAGTSACDLEDKKCPKCGALLKKEGHDIPFETFLGFKGNKEPDIDLNFSSEYQSNAHDYTEIIFGHGQTFRAGTVGTLAEKTAYGYVKKYCEEHEISKRSGEIERIAAGCEGVRRSTGQHPGGIVVLPVGEEIYTFTPVQHPANDMETKTITTHFDYHKIDANLLKLDILGHQDPTMIRMLEDLTGVDAGKLPMDDKEVLSLFESTEALGIRPEDIMGCPLGCLGIPEFGTQFVIGMVQDAKPKNFSDLVRISGLSHGTDVWLNNAQYYITEGYCTLSSAICTRDDIMTYLISMGLENERAFEIMEKVRKGIVAKGKCDQWEEWKKDMLSHHVPEWYVESCQKIKYMFPKAHAAAYVMMALRVAWFKVHEPKAYYAAYFSIRATSFNYELMCQGKEVLEHHMKEYMKRKNAKGKEKLSAKEESTLEDMKLVQEMYARGIDFMPLDIYRAKANRFQIIDGKLMPSFATIDGLGDKAAEMIEDEAGKERFLSMEDFKNRCKVSSTNIETMERMGLFGDLPHTNQISLLDFMEM